MIGAGIGWLIYQNRSNARATENHGDYDYGDEDFSGTYEGYGSSAAGYEAGRSEDSPYQGESSGSMNQGLKDKAASIASQAKDKLSSLGSQAREKVSDVAGRGREKLGEARHRAADLTHRAQERGRELYGQARERAVTAADQHPLEVGLGFLALGVLAGLAVPTPTVVTRRIAPAADKIRRAGSELLEKGKRVGKAAGEAARVEAKTQGLTLEHVRDQVGAVAERAGEAAAESANKEGLSLGGKPPADPTSARPPM